MIVSHVMTPHVNILTNYDKIIIYEPFLRYKWIQHFYFWFELWK